MFGALVGLCLFLMGVLAGAMLIVFWGSAAPDYDDCGGLHE